MNNFYYLVGTKKNIVETDPDQTEDIHAVDRDQREESIRQDIVLDQDHNSNYHNFFFKKLKLNEINSNSKINIQFYILFNNFIKSKLKNFILVEIIYFFFKKNKILNF